MSSRWKTFDEAKIAEILGVIGNDLKHFDEIFTELKNRDEKVRIGSKTTLNQYLKHLIKKGQIQKTLSPVEGKRIAYRITSKEDVKMAIQAYEALQNYETFTNYEEEFARSIIRSRRYPPLNPLDPRAIKVIGQSFSQDPRTPLEYLTEYTTRITHYIYHELKIQLETYEKITKTNNPNQYTPWIESSFNRIERTIRLHNAWVATLQLAKHYKHDELLEAIDELDKNVKTKS